MILKCSECGKVMRKIQGRNGTSHGICQSCLPKVLSAMGIELEEFIQSYPNPVALFDSNGHIVGTNTQFRGIYPTNQEAEEQLLNTQVFDKTDTAEAQKVIGTDTVSLRKMLLRTQQTGDNRSGEPLSTETMSSATQRIRRVRSQKMGNLVVLELED
jgi:hypothetical protein